MGNGISAFSAKVAAASDVMPVDSMSVQFAMTSNANSRNVLVRAKKISEFCRLEARADSGMFHFGLLLRNSFHVPQFDETFPYLLVHALRRSDDWDQLKFDFFFAKSVQDCEKRLTAVLGSSGRIFSDTRSLHFTEVDRSATAQRLVESVVQMVTSGFMPLSQDSAQNMVTGDFGMHHNCVRAALSLEDVLLARPAGTSFDAWLELNRGRVVRLAQLTLTDLPYIDCMDVFFWQDLREDRGSGMKLQQHKLANGHPTLHALSRGVRSVASWSVHSNTYRVIIPSPDRRPNASHREIHRGDDLEEVTLFFDNLGGVPPVAATARVGQTARS